MKQILFCMAVIAMMLFSCSAGINKEKTAADAAPGASPQNITQTGGQNPHEDWDRKIIKKAEVEISVNNYVEFDSKLHAGLQPYGAYVSTEEQQSNEYRKANIITIRVAVDQFDGLLNSLNGDSITVISKKISSAEVNGEMVDVQSRILAKKQVRERYLDLLKQAKNMKEIFEVQKEVNAIQEDIESAQGRLVYLQNQSAYSTIELNYWQLLDAVRPAGPNRFVRFITDLKHAFLTSVDVITGIILFFVSLWPLILIAVIGFLWWKKTKLKAAA